MFSQKLKWQEKEEKVSEKLVLKDTPRRHPVLTSRASPSPLSADSPAEVVSRESLPSSMMTLESFSRTSWNPWSETPSLTANTPREKPWPPWTSSTLSRDKEEPSTASASDLNLYILEFKSFFYTITSISTSFYLHLTDEPSPHGLLSLIKQWIYLIGILS